MVAASSNCRDRRNLLSRWFFTRSWWIHAGLVLMYFFVKNHISTTTGFFVFLVFLVDTPVFVQRSYKKMYPPASGFALPKNSPRQEKNSVVGCPPLLPRYSSPPPQIPLESIGMHNWTEGRILCSLSSACTLRPCPWQKIWGEWLQSPHPQSGLS